MSMQSMTGFARSDGSDAAYAWVWEMRSVNGRGLDVRLRLPPGFEALETPAREAVAKRLVRGNVNATLTLQRQAAATQIRLNEAALAQVLKAAERLQQIAGCDKPRADGLLAMKGVLEVVEDVEDESAVERRRTAILKSLDAALDGLVAARRSEGARLATVLAAQVSEIERHAGLVAASPARTPDAIGRRLKEQIARLTEGGPGLDPQRLHQEAVLLATKADVEEELQRLAAHVEAARELLAAPGSVGRKFDFLTQEFNREANTLCSKSNDVEITRHGLALKTIIDQMREQVQNIE